MPISGLTCIWFPYLWVALYLILLSPGCLVSRSLISWTLVALSAFSGSPSTLIPFIQVPLISGLFLLPFLLVILSPGYPFSGSPCNWIPYLKVPSYPSSSNFQVPLSLGPLVTGFLISRSLHLLVHLISGFPYLLVILSPGCPISGSPCNWIPYLKVPSSPSFSHFGVPLSPGCPISGSPCNWIPYLKVPPSPSSSNFWVVLSLGLLVTGFPISSPPILVFPCFLVLVLNSRPTSGGIYSLCYLLYSQLLKLHTMRGGGDFA